MQRKPVESSQIKSVGYDPKTKTLEIEFVQGGSVYQYVNVSPEVYEELMGVNVPADQQQDFSVGSYFIRNIKKRPDLYPYKKVEAAKPA